MSNLTNKQLLNAFKKHPYLLLRIGSPGMIVAVNSKVAMKGLIGKHQARPLSWFSQETLFAGYVPCSFQMYITKKIPITA